MLGTLPPTHLVALVYRVGARRLGPIPWVPLGKNASKAWCGALAGNLEIFWDFCDAGGGPLFAFWAWPLKSRDDAI